MGRVVAGCIRRRACRARACRRDAHAADAEVAQAEDALAVGDDDHFDIARRRVLKDATDLGAVWVRDVEAARASEDVAVALAARAHGRRVDDGHHLVDMLFEESVEEGLVAILVRDEEDVALDVGLLRAVVLVDARELLLHSRGVRRQKARQAELAPLLFGERAPLV
jgi:hypothetical protein